MSLTKVLQCTYLLCVSVCALCRRDGVHAVGHASAAGRCR